MPALTDTVKLTHQDAPSLDRSHALVVDDDQDSREALAILLTWAGYDVVTADNGADALSKAQSFRPQVIFLDIGMPEMSGYEVCRKLRTSMTFQDARIYALSGFTGAEHDTRCSEAGFTGQFTKPIDPAVIPRLH
jgi:CheY-like chemotaxis protein